MAKRSAPAARASPPAPAATAAPAPALDAQPEEPINPQNISDAEKDAIERASKAISILENALASWEASKDKPEDLVPDFQRFRRLRDALAEWETKMLRASGKEADFFRRVDRLWEFVRICRAYT